MLTICDVLDRLETAPQTRPDRTMIEAQLDDGARAALYDYIRAERRYLVDQILAALPEAPERPSFASSLLYAGFLDRLCQALQRNEFAPLEMWAKYVAADPQFDPTRSRSLTIACAVVASDIVSKCVPGYREIQRYLMLVAVDLEATLTNARLGRQGTRTLDPKQVVPIENVVYALVTLIRAHDPYLYEHSLTVSALCGRIGAALRATPEQVGVLERCGLLHAIGKVGIARSILHKRGPLSDEEWTAIKGYPITGAALLRTMPALAIYAPIVRFQRERLDGFGYPSGASAPDIPIQSKILSVALSFDAMIHDRPYRPAHTVEFALEELQKGEGTRYDPEVVHALIRLVKPASAKPEDLQRALQV